MRSINKERSFKTFMRFLKENNASTQYMNNCIKRYGNAKNAINIILTNHPLFFVINAFSWLATKEGSAYWTNIAEKWECYWQLARTKKNQ